jgi:putative peptidoglycan lipid II flippase
MGFLTSAINKIKNLGLFNGFGFLVNAQKTIVSAAFILVISSATTAILGLLKVRLLTSYFGVTDELGIFYTADKIPNLIYSVLVVGALSTIFIPVFTQLINEDKEKAWETASAIISIGVLVFFILGIFAMVFAGPIINLISLGQFTSEQVTLGANLMRLMIVAQLILVLSSFATSILQSFKYFIVPAMAPVLYNLGIIGGIVFLNEGYGIYGPAIGVIIGAILHFLVQIPLLRRADFKYNFSLNVRHQNVLEMVKLMPPRILSVIFNQLVSTISNSLAILISTSSVVLLKSASQLQFFPVHLFGASMAAASLPVLSEHANGLNHTKFKKIFLTTFHQTLFLVMPVSIILLILRIPVVRLVYGVPNFPWEATVTTAYALAFFSISIFSQSVVYLITRAFYALKDTLTPVKVSFFTIILNVTLSVYFIRYLGFGVWAIALSYSITSILDMLVMLYLLSKRLGGFEKERLIVPFVKISYAAVFMGITLYVPLKILDETVFNTARTVDLIFLTGLVGIAGMVSYLFFTWIFKVQEIELLFKILRRLRVVEAPATHPAAVLSEYKEQ